MTDLRWVAWEVTRRCNLACVHCRSSSDLQASTQGPTLTVGKDLLDQLGEIGPVVVLTGGEPLLRPDLTELVAHGAGLGLRIGLATNGTLLTPEVCRDLVGAGVRIVSLSLDGASARVHDSFRKQQGAFDAAVAAARLLRELGVDFIVNSSFTRRNSHDVAATLELARSLGAKAWYMFLIVPTGRGEELLAELVPRDEYEALLRWHYRMEKDERSILVRPTCAPQYYRIISELDRESGTKLERRALSFGTGGGRGCVAGQLICMIDADGEVHPCSYFPRSAGSIRETPLRRIWEESELLRSLREPKLLGGRCGRCEHARVCSGCRARAEILSGSHLAEDPYCAYEPRAKRGSRSV